MAAPPACPPKPETEGRPPIRRGESALAENYLERQTIFVITRFSTVITNVAFFVESPCMRQNAVLMRALVVVRQSKHHNTTGQFHEHP
jgi:hypothetical protein